MFVKDKATGKKVEIKSARYNSEIHGPLGEEPKFKVTKVVDPYGKYSRQHLMKLAKEKGIRILSTMKKDEIKAKLIEHDKSVESQK